MNEEVYLTITTPRMKAGQFVPLVVYENELETTIKKYESLGYTIKIFTYEEFIKEFRNGL